MPAETALVVDADPRVDAVLKLALASQSWRVQHADDWIEVLAATPVWIRLAARCELSTAERLVRFVDEIADLPDPERDDVAIAFREMR